MATAHDYFDFLTDQIEISPANSQEELNAAQTISDLMKEHGLETNVEEFDAASFGRLPFAILLIVMFIGTFLAGIGGLPLALIGGLITLACVAVLVLDHLGNNILESFGPAARSQNVVAMHEASGPLVAKGNRPVVIMAHYDTPRESFLYSSGIAKFLPVLRRYTPWCVVAAGVSAFFQIHVLIGDGHRIVHVSIFQGDQRGDQLGDTGGIDPGESVLCVQGFVGVYIEKKTFLPGRKLDAIKGHIGVENTQIRGKRLGPKVLL